MNTVLNLSNNRDNKLFLGDELSIQRYDNPKYPIFIKLWRDQKEFSWMPEEVKLDKDRSDYEALNETEKFIFNSNLRWQTMTDSMLSRSIHQMSKYVSNSELEICMSVWSDMETVHSFSYTWILQNIRKDPSKFFDSILEDKEIVRRAQEIKEAYDRLLNSEKSDIKQKIFDSLLSTQITEGLAFYSSFACSFFFGYNGKMEGNAKIIKLISRDENCVDDKTEILTTNGWKLFEDLNNEDKVAQYEKDGNITFIKPIKIIKKDYDGDMISISNVGKHVDMLLTPDHRVIFESTNSNNEMKECLAKDFRGNFLKKIPVAGISSNDQDFGISMYERFLIALQADGSLNDPELRNGKISGCKVVTFNLKKERKIKRLKWILSELGFEYTDSLTKKKQTSFYIKVPLSYNLFKFFKDWDLDISKVSRRWCNEFIEESMNWDGSIRKDTGTYVYSSTCKSNIDFCQSLAILCGYKTSVYHGVDNRSESYSDCYRLSILPEKRTQSGQSLIKKSIPYKGNVYCVSVPSGMFVARRNNGVFVTGNCHVGITQNILKILRENEEEGFVDVIKSNEQKVYDMYGLAVENEKKWIEYLFSQGSLLGLNGLMLSNYVEWLANARLTSLGYNKIFDQKINPLKGWLSAYTDSQNMQVAPQETEISSYRIGSRDTSINMDDFKDFEL